MKLSFIFEFQLVLFAFSLIKVLVGGIFFPKIAFHEGKMFRGKNYREIFLNSGGGVSQNAFFSNLNTVNLEIFPNHRGAFT